MISPSKHHCCWLNPYCSKGLFLSRSRKIFDSFAQQNRLILSFHFYSPPATGSFEEVIQLAKKNAIKLGGTLVKILPCHCPKVFFSLVGRGLSALVLSSGNGLVFLGKFEPETPNQLNGKNPWVSGEDFPKKTNPLTVASPSYRGFTILFPACSISPVDPYSGNQKLLWPR